MITFFKLMQLLLSRRFYLTEIKRPSYLVKTGYSICGYYHTVTLLGIQYTFREKLAV